MSTFKKSALFLILFSMLSSAAQLSLAAEHAHTCTGATNAVREGKIRVNILRSSGGDLKATLLEGSSSNTWDTYHVTERSGTFSGADHEGREFRADIDGNSGTLIKATAPDVNSPAGFIELTGITLRCSS